MSDDKAPVSPRLAGIITTAELAAAGVPPAGIRRFLRRGVLLQVGHGVYAQAGPAAEVAGWAGGQALPIAAALATMGPGVVASHHSAASIHDLQLLGRLPAAVAVTRPPGTGSRTGRPGVRVHAAALPAGHETSWRGVPLTSVARTVVDWPADRRFGPAWSSPTWRCAQGAPRRPDFSQS